MQIFAHQDNPNVHYLQQWTGHAMADISWRATVSDLTDIENSIVLLDSTESNYQIDLVKKLIDQYNRLVFVDLFGSPNLDDFHDLLLDLPESDRYWFVSSCSYANTNAINVNAHLHLQIDSPNRLRAENVFGSVFATSSKPYKYNWLNVRARYHRCKLWHILQQKKLIDHGLCSWHNDSRYAKECGINEPQPISFRPFPLQYQSVFSEWLTDDECRQDLHRRYMMPWKKYHQHWSTQHIVPRRYQDSYFTVIVESDIQHPMLTAQAYNALLTGHPVLILGAAGICDYLRSLGFKTLSAWVDESWDSIQDPELRILTFAEEIYRLCHLDLDKWLQAVKPVCDYNRAHYLSSHYELWLNTHQNLDELFGTMIYNS